MWPAARASRRAQAEPAAAPAPPETARTLAWKHLKDLADRIGRHKNADPLTAAHLDRSAARIRGALEGYAKGE